MNIVLAETANERIRITLRAAPAVTLHTGDFWRTDGNSPVLAEHGRLTVFFSGFEPRGHTLRRGGCRAQTFEGKSVPVRLIDDPDPQMGKWIEAVWRDPTGPLRGWYHAEEAAPCPAPLFVPHIGELVSRDDGLSWHYRGELLRGPADQVDCSWRNGFFAGGYGDFSVVQDRKSSHLYLAFSSYLVDESAQGVAMARLPTERTAAPAAGLDLWCAKGWQPIADGRLPKPLWCPARGWRHSDPDGFWGPAVHYNQGLDAYVMLLNRTAGGAGDLVQEGIYVSINKVLEDPQGWSAPLQIVRGGAWYPQVVGPCDGQGDTSAGSIARFFMGGFSAWEIEFQQPGQTNAINCPLHPTKADFAELFGPGKRCPW
jgi:hypothetical protein